MVNSDIKSFQDISQIIYEEFSALNSEQLNFKVNTNEWSIAQCLDHLIVSNEKYFPVLQKIQAKNYTMTFWERNNPFSKKIGRQMIQNLGPVVRKKYVSPKIFQPGKSNIRISIVSDFVQHQNKLIDLIKVISNEQYSKLKISSPVAALITFSIADLIQLLFAHEQRHLEQMRKVKNKLEKSS